MVIETSIGNYLHKLRKERKLSLRDVADQIGIDVSMLSKIEHGERQLQSHMLKRIAEIFNVDFQSLQMSYLSTKIRNEFGNEPYLKEVVIELSKELK